MSDLLIHNVRLLDPASGLDTPGAILVRAGRIADLGANLGRPDGATMVDGDGAVLCPGLVDMRADVGEPGGEYRETIASAAAAAAFGGITTLAALPDTNPAIDDPALVRHLRARGEETGSLTILPYGAATKGCRGEELAELGLLHEAGAVAFTDGARAIGSARMMHLILSYAAGFGARVVQHPEEPSLAEGGAATSGELATRLGLPAIPAAAEALMVARDIRLALPNSLRVTASGGINYIEFIMTSTGGRYRYSGDGSTAGNFLSFTGPTVSFDVLGGVPTNPAIAPGDYIVVNNFGPGYDPADAYAGGNRAQVAAAWTGVNPITLTAATQNVFSSQSPPLPSANNRFQVVPGAVRAVTYACPAAAGNFMRYWNYGFNAAQPTAFPGGSSAVLASGASCTVEYTANATGRNGLLYVKLTLTDATSGESVSLFQQIHVANAP